MSVKDCPNKDRLSEDERRKVEEENYRIQEKYEWGYHPGDPRLKSSDKIRLEERD
jgi:hypothetical protein